MMSTALFASIVVGIVGFMLLWANPNRKVNRAVFGSSSVVAAWLGCGHLAVTQPLYGLFWVRWTCVIGALAPLSLWVVKEAIAGGFHLRDRAWLSKGVFWFVSALVLSAIPLSGYFIPEGSTDALRLHGVGYYVYYVGLPLLYLKLLRDALLSLKAITGVKKLELQVWLCGGCVAATSIYLLIALGALTHDSLYRKLSPVVILIFYAGTAYVITSYRIFDARQILLVGVKKIALVLFASGVAVASNIILGFSFSGIGAVALTTAAILVSGGVAGSWLDRKLQFLPHDKAAREAAFAAAQRETRVESLQESFETVLKGWGQAERVVILSGTTRILSSGGIEVDTNSEAVVTLKSLRWVTPERLVRERSSLGREMLYKLCVDNGLGVLVMEEGPSLTVIVGLAVGASRRPYTFPQVTQLMELASIIQAALERAHFSAKAQRAEQLATVGLLGASLAHEIRNPLVSIKTFVQLLPTHYQDPVFREKFFRLIGDEVGRIDQLTDQLLDLASPRKYLAQPVELHVLLQSSIELVAAKAAHRGIELITDFQAKPDRAFTDAAAAKQVVLNLCFNAIQAVDGSSERGDRWVKVGTRNMPSGIEMAVSDSGPGISPEIRPKLFQPFQTTKSTGFGLGLAICSDILAHLNASITVDAPEPNRGATFRVIFPCQPSLS